MIEVVETEDFRRWMDQLKDAIGRNRIVARLRRIAMGNLGDWKPVGSGVAEMRIDSGPGYRIYFTRRDQKMIIILVGGTKRTQTTDIAKAIEIAKQF